MVKVLSILAAAVAIACGAGRPAWALPVFAHRYDLSCGTCHTVVPHLTPFGQSFLRAGFRLPAARAAFPLAVKVNLAYSSDADPSGLPKAMVDEVELLAAAPLGRNASYRVEQYAVDGGTTGKTRDAWLSFTSRPDFGDPSPALRITAGSFTLPLPLDPETQRDTESHYAAFDQKVGSNPFDLFEDKIGIDTAFGTQSGEGTDVHVVAAQGHDAQSGLAASGIDELFYAQRAWPATTLSVYRYQGRRPLKPDADRFWRDGAGLTAYDGRVEFDALVQAGSDSSADGRGTIAWSDAGYAQVRWTCSPALFGVIRYDAAADALSGSGRSLTTALIVRPARDERFTVEGVFHGTRTTLDAGWLFAY